MQRLSVALGILCDRRERRDHDDRTPTHGYGPTRKAAMACVRQELAAGSGARASDQ
jgi:hypothetical protein